MQSNKIQARTFFCIVLLLALMVGCFIQGSAVIKNTSYVDLPVKIVRKVSVLIDTEHGTTVNSRTLTVDHNGFIFNASVNNTGSRVTADQLHAKPGDIITIQVVKNDIVPVADSILDAICFTIFTIGVMLFCILMGTFKGKCVPTIASTS